MAPSPAPSPAPAAPEAIHAWIPVSPVPILAYDGPVPGWALRLRVQNPYHGWWWLREGRAEIRRPGERLRLAPGDWIFFPSAWPRHQLLSAGAHLVSVAFELAWPHGAPVLAMDAPLLGRGDADLLRLGARVAALCADPATRFEKPLPQRKLPLPAWLRARAALDELAAELARRSLEAGARVSPRSPPDPRLGRVLADLEEHPRAGPLPYVRWSAASGLGRAQLDRLARQHLGRSLRSWRDARLDRAIRHRLRAARSSMKEIAAEFGFADAAHFTHWTRRRLGVPPAHWREELA